MSEEIVFVPCKTKGCVNSVKPPREVCRPCETIVSAKAARKAKLEIAANAKAKEYVKESKERAAQAESQQEIEAAESWGSLDAVKKGEAKDIFRDHRNLTQGYIVNAAYECGMIAAKRLRLVPNRYFWKHGVLSALESQKAGEAVDVLPAYNDTKAYGEVFREQDQIALWDFACSWREQPLTRGHDWEGGHRITLKEYRELRCLKKDPIRMGNLLLDGEFEHAPQANGKHFIPFPTSSCCLRTIPRLSSTSHWKRCMILRST